MLNRYSLWKNLMILGVVLFGFYYAAPNLYAPDPALQIGGASGSQTIDSETLQRATEALSDAGINHFGEELQDGGKSGLIRLGARDDQLRAQSVLSRALGDNYIIALNLAPTTPDWLVSGGAQPMKLGLDLSGGVHFKLEVDVAAATERRLEMYEAGIKRGLREKRLRGLVRLQGRRIGMSFRDEATREAARSVTFDLYPELRLDRVDGDESWEPVSYTHLTLPTNREV